MPAPSESSKEELKMRNKFRISNSDSEFENWRFLEFPNLKSIVHSIFGWNSDLLDSLNFKQFKLWTKSGYQKDLPDLIQKFWVTFQTSVRIDFKSMTCKCEVHITIPVINFQILQEKGSI